MASDTPALIGKAVERFLGEVPALAHAAALVGAVVMGQVADKIGRRNALVITMIGFGTGLLGALVVTDFTGLVVQRLYLGFFMGSMFPIAVGIYSGLFARDVRGRIAGIVLPGFLSAMIAGVDLLDASVDHRPQTGVGEPRLHGDAPGQEQDAAGQPDPAGDEPDQTRADHEADVADRAERTDQGSRARPTTSDLGHEQRPRDRDPAGCQHQTGRCDRRDRVARLLTGRHHACSPIVS